MSEDVQEREAFLEDFWMRADRLEGTRLQEAERSLLEEAAWQEYREGTLKGRHEAMTDAQRKKKTDLIAKWNRGLRTPLLLDFVTFSRKRAWFKAKDAQKVFDLDTVTYITRLSVRLFGKDYADAILKELEGAYAKNGEEVVVLRRPS